MIRCVENGKFLLKKTFILKCEHRVINDDFLVRPRPLPPSTPETRRWRKGVDQRDNENQNQLLFKPNALYYEPIDENDGGGCCGGGKKKGKDEKLREKEWSLKQKEVDIK